MKMDVDKNDSYLDSCQSQRVTCTTSFVCTLFMFDNPLRKHRGQLMCN